MKYVPIKYIENFWTTHPKCYHHKYLPLMIIYTHTRAYLTRIYFETASLSKSKMAQNSFVLGCFVSVRERTLAIDGVCGCGCLSLNASTRTA